MKKATGYKACDSEDLDPFNSCKPVNCELKYFGKRNFFNISSCVSAKLCDNNDDEMYDYENNECTTFGKVFSKEELEEMKMGKFSNWIDAKDFEVTETKSFNVTWKVSAS